jgi:hypothetical protein
MNAGLTNLDTLRKTLLASSLAGETKFDDRIKVIGLGMAGAFDKHCNRRLGYKENDTMQFSGDRPHYYLPRYPIVSVAAIQMKYFRTDAWTDISDQPISMNEEIGLVHFGYTLGRHPLQVKATWTGGYWFETKEPEDDGYPSAAPAGATLLPDDLRSAFLLQCERVWYAGDQLGMGLVGKPGEESGIERLELAPLVKTILKGYVRYQLS